MKTAQSLLWRPSLLNWATEYKESGFSYQEPHQSCCKSFETRKSILQHTPTLKMEDQYSSISWVRCLSLWFLGVSDEK